MPQTFWEYDSKSLETIWAVLNSFYDLVLVIQYGCEYKMEKLSDNTQLGPFSFSSKGNLGGGGGIKNNPKKYCKGELVIHHQGA